MLAISGLSVMNAKEITNSIVMVSKVTAIVSLFRQTFPKLRIDLAPWQQDDVTNQYVDPGSIDIGFHFPGRSPSCQCRSILVQVYVAFDAAKQPERVEKVELAGYDHQGQCWWFSTASYWQFMGNFMPDPEQRDTLRSLCCQIFNVLMGETLAKNLRVGLTEAELCRQFGFVDHIISTAAQQAELSTEAYLLKLTGWAFKEGCYYPISV
jgi:hypothetical protein